MMVLERLQVCKRKINCEQKVPCAIAKEFLIFHDFGQFVEKNVFSAKRHS